MPCIEHPQELQLARNLKFSRFFALDYPVLILSLLKLSLILPLKSIGPGFPWKIKFNLLPPRQLQMKSLSPE